MSFLAPPSLAMMLQARIIKITANVRAAAQPAKKPEVFPMTKFKGKKLISGCVML